MANTGNTQQQINYGAAANDGQGDPLRTAFIKTDDNFDAIWLAGPVGSNITIVNNTVQANNTNGSIVLRPNGVGAIQANAAILPNATNLRDLGTADLRFRAAYIGTGGLSVDGNVTVTGNLTAGNISYTGNVFVGDLQGSVFADDSTIMVDAIDNEMFASAATFGQVDVSGNITANYFIGNGSLLTDIAGNYSDANVADFLANNFGSNTISTFGNISAGAVRTGAIVNDSPINITTSNFTWQFAGDILRGPEGGSWQSASDTVYLTSPANGYITLESQLNGNTVSELFMEHSFIRFFIDNGIDATWQMLADGRTEFPSYIFPYADGNAGEVLKTDGSGNLAWAADSSDYGNANVAAYLGTGIAGNIIPSANAIYSLGNATNYWSNLWVANNTIYIGGVPLGVTGNVLTVNGESVTGNITFTDTTMSPPDGVDITINAANSEVIIEAFDIRLDAAGDLRLTGNDIVSLRNRSTTDPVTIITDYDDTETTWTFAVDGSLTTPGDIVVAGDVTGTAGANTLVLKAQPASNTAIQLNNSVDSVISTVANLEIRTDVSNTAKTWEFDTSGNLTAPGNVSATGNITGGNIITAGRVVASGNILGLNFGTEGSVQASEVQAGNITGANLSVTGNISGNTAGFALGYRDIPQVAFTGNATIAAADAGKHFYSTESTDYILTIADNSAVSWPVGTAITVVNRGTGNITVAQASGVSLYLAGNSSAGNRTVNTYGMATVLNVAANVWMINGTGVL